MLSTYGKKDEGSLLQNQTAIQSVSDTIRASSDYIDDEVDDGLGQGCRLEQRAGTECCIVDPWKRGPKGPPPDSTDDAQSL